MDYQFLIGEQFLVEGETFTVAGVRVVDGRVVMEATTQTADARAFTAEDVIEALVTEEIELFQTGGLAN